MTTLNITHQRMHNQLMTQPKFEKPEDVVRWMGAVQAQDYAGAKWALGLRLPHATDNDIEQALTDGTILRTHIMRPTWHFVPRADIRWMLALTSPRVRAASVSGYRNLELDDTTFARSNAVLTKALQDGKQYTRSELQSTLEQAGITTNDLRLTYIMMRAELDTVICSGARKGKQFTYALLDERAPDARILDRDDALAELTRRYFTSHGPATLQDYVWWSGLLATDARNGIEMLKSELASEISEGNTYWFPPSLSSTKDTAHLLPPFDEYTVAYKDRSAVIDPLYADQVGNSILGPIVVINGRVLGTWKRTFKKNSVFVAINPFAPLNENDTHAINTLKNRYATFLAMTIGQDEN